MAYNTNILNRLDALEDSQPELLANFAAIATLLGQDHVNFNVADAGKHNKLTMPEKNKASIPNTNATDYGMFVSNLPLNGALFPNILNFQSSGTTSAQSFPGSFSGAHYTQAPFIIDPVGSMRLPSGILIKWANYTRFQLLSPTDDARMEFNWGQKNNVEDFVQQYWALITPIATNGAAGDQDNPVVFTVYDVTTSPYIIKLLCFLKNPPLGSFPSPVKTYEGGLFVLAIGV